VASGCGGSTGTSNGSGSTTASDQPPSNPDAPRASGDQAPSSADAPPSGPDSPPVSADTPAGSGTGGRLGGLCRQICTSLADAIDHCNQGDSMAKLSVDCGGADACQVPAEVLPCENQLVAVFQCFIDNVAMLCPAGGQNADQGQGQDPAGSTAALCVDSANAAQACATAHHIDLGSNMMDMTNNMNMKPPAADCTKGNACTQCMCKAANDATKIEACFTGDCANQNP
jgi:hypothetical protein